MRKRVSYEGALHELEHIGVVYADHAHVRTAAPSSLPDHAGGDVEDLEKGNGARGDAGALPHAVAGGTQASARPRPAAATC